MSVRRVWSIEEANALVPMLTELVGEQLARATDIERRWNELQSATRLGNERSRAATANAFEQVTPAFGDAERAALERELEERIRSYEAGWGAVEALGAVVKDARVGLCDFYGQVDGRYVWLCWRFGERSIGFYHGLDAGFAGRKALTPAARLRQLN